MPPKCIMKLVCVLFIAIGLCLIVKNPQNLNLTIALWALIVSYFFPLFTAIRNKNQWTFDKEYKCLNNIICEANKYSFLIDDYIKGGGDFDSLINLNKIELLTILKSNINDLEIIKKNFLLEDYKDSQKDMKNINSYYKKLKQNFSRLNKANSTSQTYFILKGIDFLIHKTIENCNQQIVNSLSTKSLV